MRGLCSLSGKSPADVLAATVATQTARQRRQANAASSIGQTGGGSKYAPPGQIVRGPGGCLCSFLLEYLDIETRPDTGSLTSSLAALRRAPEPTKARAAAGHRSQNGQIVQTPVGQFVRRRTAPLTAWWHYGGAASACHQALMPPRPATGKAAGALGVPVERLAEGVEDPAEEESEPAPERPRRRRKWKTSWWDNKHPPRRAPSAVFRPANSTPAEVPGSPLGAACREASEGFSLTGDLARGLNYPSARLPRSVWHATEGLSGGWHTSHFLLSAALPPISSSASRR
jgi:hypothetical protein